MKRIFNKSLFGLLILLVSCLVFVAGTATADLAEDAAQATKGGANSLEKLKERARKDGALNPEDEDETGSEISNNETSENTDFPDEFEDKKLAKPDFNIQRPPYSSKGKRDPFKPFIQTPRETKEVPISESTPPIKRYALSQYRIVGIIRYGNDPKAMVVDPEQNTYYLGIDDEIGNKNGKIVEVRDNGLLVQEKRFYEDVFGNSKVEVKKSVLAFVEEEG